MEIIQPVNIHKAWIAK